MPYRVSIVTLYPEMFPGPLGYSLAGSALKNGLFSLETVNPRAFGIGKHRQVDDTPAGGGPGMVLRADVLARAIDSVSPPDDDRPRLLMSPRGMPLTQSAIRDYAGREGLLIVCGRFEGVDERLATARNLQEVSVGDYVLSGGEPAAIVLLDAIVRLLPSVIGNEQSILHESFENNRLEYPQYTRPAEFEGMTIPPVLVSGDHGRIEQWRHEQALALTKKRRPDLVEDAQRRKKSQ